MLVVFPRQVMWPPIVIIISCRVFLQGFLGDASVKNSPVSAGDARDTG